MSGRRLPIVIVLAVVLVAAFVVDARREQPVGSTDAVSAGALSPLATSADAGTSTWFCAGGTASVTGVAEQTVTITNPTDAPAAGTLQLFVEGQPAPQSFPVDVGAHDRRAVVLSSLAQGEWAAALVELDRGGLVVTHDVLGVGGWDSDRCSTQASDRWYFPWGQTSPQEASSLRLALFNPFAVEAVVDITFDTEDGFRSPEALQGFLVPARRLVTVELTELVPVRQRISTSIVARSGRLVADRVQALSGTDGTVTLDVTPGAPGAAESWYFADGRVDPATLERIAIYNPAEETAQVEVEVQRPRRADDLAIEPFELQVAPQSYAEVVLNHEGRIPQPLRHSTIVRVLNGVPIVAERVQLSGTVVAAAATAPADGAAAGTDTVPREGTAAPTETTVAPPGDATSAPATDPGAVLPPLPPGLAAAMGSPVVATRWVLPDAARPDTSAKAVITNVSADQPVRLAVTAFAAGQPVPLDPAPPNELEPRQQLELPMAVTAAGQPVQLHVEASGPVVVDGVHTYAPLPDASVQSAVPLPDGVIVPDPLDPGAVPATVAASPPGAGRPSAPSTTVPLTPVTTPVPATSVPSTATTAVAETTTAPPDTAPPDTAPPDTAPPDTAAPTESTVAPDG